MKHAIPDSDLLSILELPNHAILLIQSETSGKYNIRQCTFADGTVVIVNPILFEFGDYARLFIEESLAKKYVEANIKFEKTCHCSGYLCARKNPNAKYRECVTDWSI